MGEESAGGSTLPVRHTMLIITGTTLRCDVGDGHTTVKNQDYGAVDWGQLLVACTQVPKAHTTNELTTSSKAFCASSRGFREDCTPEIRRCPPGVVEKVIAMIQQICGFLYVISMFTAKSWFYVFPQAAWGRFCNSLGLQSCWVPSISECEE